MTNKPYDLAHAKSHWFLDDMGVESTVGDRMRANFSIDCDELPNNMVDLLRRLSERETPAAPHSRVGERVRTSGRGVRDDPA